MFGGEPGTSSDGPFGLFVHAVIFLPLFNACWFLPISTPAVSGFHQSVSQFSPSTRVLGAEWPLLICSCGFFPLAVLWALVPKNPDCQNARSAHRPPLFACLPHDLGPFVLLCLLGELLLFAFHITGPVSIESVLLCMASNADTHFAIVFLDLVIFFPYLIQFPASLSVLFFIFFFHHLISHLHRPCMFRNFEAVRRCSWKVMFASRTESFLQVRMPCCPCLFQNLFIDTMWIFSHVCSVTWTNMSRSSRLRGGEEKGSSLVVSVSLIPFWVWGIHCSSCIFPWGLYPGMRCDITDTPDPDWPRGVFVGFLFAPWPPVPSGLYLFK